MSAVVIPGGALALLSLLAGCASAPNAGRAAGALPEREAKGLPVTVSAPDFAPPGWWIDAADQINPSDVGSAGRFTESGFVLVKPDGLSENVTATLAPAGKNRWTLQLSEGDPLKLERIGQGLHLTRSDGKSVDFRPAGADETRKLDAAHP